MWNRQSVNIANATLAIGCLFHARKNPIKNPPPHIACCGVDDFNLAVYCCGFRAMTRPSWKKAENRHNDKRYRKHREIIRQRDPQCIRCLHSHGIIKPMAEVDHYINIAQGGTHDLINLWGLCRDCHSEKTINESHGRSGFHERIDPATGWPMEEPDWSSIIANRHSEWLRKLTVA